MPEVLNTAFFLPFGKRGTTREAAEAALIQDLICYRSVWILTDQMSAVPRLIEIMGLREFERAVSEGTVKFVHDRNILAWPVVPGYRGLVPFEAIGSLPKQGGRVGFTQAPTRETVFRLLLAYGGDLKPLRRLSSLVEDVTVEFGDITDGIAAVAPQKAHNQMLASLKVYEEAAERMSNSPLQARDLKELRRNLQGPKRARLVPIIFGGKSTYKVMTIQQRTGPESIEPEEELPRKQLALLNMVLSDRFLLAHAALNSAATLHSEPAVEEVLAARVSAIRKAAANELDVVLKGERVYLPALASPGPFPYDKLLEARISLAGLAFQGVVQRRDDDSSAELLQEYLAALDRRLADRFIVKVVRFIATKLAGLQGPITGALADVADAFVVEKLLSRTDARVYVDKSLRRMAAQPE